MKTFSLCLCCHSAVVSVPWRSGTRLLWMCDPPFPSHEDAPNLQLLFLITTASIQAPGFRLQAPGSRLQGRSTSYWQHRGHRITPHGDRLHAGVEAPNSFSLVHSKFNPASNFLFLFDFFPHWLLAILPSVLIIYRMHNSKAMEVKYKYLQTVLYCCYFTSINVLWLLLKGRGAQAPVCTAAWESKSQKKKFTTCLEMAFSSVIHVARSSELWLKHGWGDSPSLSVNLGLQPPGEPVKGSLSLSLLSLCLPLWEPLIKRCLI